MKKRMRRAVSLMLLCLLLTPCMAISADAAFRDVPAGHPASTSIRRCVELGFFKGEQPDRFGLGHPMTRAGFAVVLGRFFGWEPVKGLDSPFQDVPASSWYAGAVQAAYDHGAFTRQSDTFRPTDPVTREELAVVLVRALGYGTIAGLVQDLPMPFRDVDTNGGYITMAWELGLMEGTSATAFSPERPATREELATILMRLYDKLHAPAVGKVGVAAGAEDLPDLSGFQAVAVAEGKLLYQEGSVRMTAESDLAETAALRQAVKAAGAAELLYAPGTANILRGSVDETARMLAETVSAGGYAGVLLDVPGVTYEQRKSLTTLVSALDRALKGKLVYVTAEAPVRQKDGGYDYTALAEKADRLVVRVAPGSGRSGGIPTAPLEPLEEVYYAMGRLKDQVGAEKLSLLLTTANRVWTGGRNGELLSSRETAALLEKSQIDGYYSDRYACAYLSGSLDRQELVVWYLDERSVAERAELLHCFGVDQICFSQLNGLLPEVLKAAR